MPTQKKDYKFTVTVFWGDDCEENLKKFFYGKYVNADFIMVEELSESVELSASQTFICLVLHCHFAYI